MTNYPVEQLSEYEDDGTMPDSVATLASHVIGRRIVSAKESTRTIKDPYGWGDNTYTEEEHGLVLTLDNDKEVMLVNSSDCCAYTELEKFWLDPTKVDHLITGVGTTDGYTKWHIYADLGDVMQLDVDWSPGNPFYYGYGFYIHVIEVADE